MVCLDKCSVFLRGLVVFGFLLGLVLALFAFFISQNQKENILWGRYYDLYVTNSRLTSLYFTSEDQH